MRPNDAPRVTLTLTQVAELAGVRASAVSNWRKRFSDFPQPVGNAAGGRDVFSLDAVEAWLIAHRRMRDAKLEERFSLEVADVLSRELDARRMTEAVCAALTLAYVTEGAGLEEGVVSPARVEREEPSLIGLFNPLAVLEPRTRSRLFELVGQVDRMVIPDLFESMLARYPRFAETRTSDRLVALLVRLLAAGSPTRSLVVFDPAAGTGDFLMAAARTLGSRAELVGQEINEAAWRIAGQRLRVHAHNALLSWDDSLLHDAYPDLRADVVLCDPPYNAKIRLTPELMADRRWTFGLPNPMSADYAWLQHVIHHLNSDGRGYVLLPTGTLHRGGRDAETRAQLLRRGAVEAVISLPPRSAEHTLIPLALWVVRRPISDEPGPVLMIDGTPGLDTPDQVLDAALTERIGQTVDAWRARGEVGETDNGFAVAVPVLDLLGPGVKLHPARWTHRAFAVDVSRRRSDFTAAVSAARIARDLLSKHDLHVPRLDGEPNSLSWVSVRELMADGRVELLRGVRIGEKDRRPTGTLVFSAAGDGSHEARYVDPSALRPAPAITRRGDVVVLLRKGRLHAEVDWRGGSVLALPAQALRLHGEWIDPLVASAFLASTRNRAILAKEGAPTAHFDLRELQLPMLSHGEVAELRTSLENLVTAETLANDLVVAVGEAREALIDLGGHIADSAEHATFGLEGSTSDA